MAEHINRGHLFWVSASSVVLLVGCFLFWGLVKETSIEGQYVPPQVVDGKLVPGHMRYEEASDE